MQIQIEESRKEIKKHGNYEYPVNVSQESIEAYEQGFFMWHWHPEIELTWVMSGEMEYRTNEQSCLLSEGEGMFCNSNTLHSGFRKDGKTCSYLSVTFHPRFLYGFESSRLQTKYVNCIVEHEQWASLKLEKDVEWHQEILAGVREIARLTQEAEDGYEMQVHILLMQIWQKLYQYFASVPEEEPLPQRNLQRLRDMVAYLQEHYSQEVTLDDIAEHVSLCKSECCRFFKRYMNMTIFEYLMYLRIQNSLPLLKKGKSVTEITGLVGFSSPAYYGQIFKRYMKCTPREYRLKNK